MNDKENIKEMNIWNVERRNEWKSIIWKEWNINDRNVGERMKTVEKK